MMMKRLLPLGVLCCAAWSASPAAAIEIGFEAFEGYVLGPLSPPSGPTQQGWSGGAQAGFTNNDPGDEQVIDSEAFSGSNSWHYARGYGSSGPGTPFSPVMGGVSGPGTSFDFSIHFKAASASGDGSEQNLYMGTAAGNDRTGFNIYLENNSAGDGLHLYTFDWISGASSKQILATQLDRSTWHEVTVNAVFAADPLDDVFEYSIDGNLVYTGNSWPNPWRVSMGFGTVYGDSIKFADGGGDTLLHEGFYYDSLLYSFAAVPEPATGALFLLALIGLSTQRRSQTAH